MQQTRQLRVKLGAHDRIELAVIAYRGGVVGLGEAPAAVRERLAELTPARAQSGSPRGPRAALQADRFSVLGRHARGERGAGDGGGAGERPDRGDAGVGEESVRDDVHYRDPLEKRDFLDWYLAREALPAGARQSLGQRAAMTGADEVLMRRWLDSIGVAFDEIAAGELPGKIPDPVRCADAREWLVAMRQYLSLGQDVELSRQRMDRLSGAAPGTWGLIESGDVEATDLLVRALLRRVPEARAAYFVVGKRFPHLGLLSDDGEARWPEGYKYLHLYLKSLRVRAGLSLRGLAKAAGRSLNTPNIIERGGYTPGRDWIDIYLSLGGAAPYAQLAECFAELAVDEDRWVFPSLSAVESLDEYNRYLQRVNYHLRDADTAPLFGVRYPHLSATLKRSHAESTVLRSWRVGLHRAGPWEAIARTWTDLDNYARYRYRMDPVRGDVFPRASLFDDPRDFAYSIRLYHTDGDQRSPSRPEWAALTGLTPNQIADAETTRGYRPPELRRLRDAGFIPDDTTLHEALDQFYPVIPAIYSADAVGLGRWLRTQRRRAGMTQQQLAPAAGVKSEHLSIIETGVQMPPLQTLRRFCDVLDIQGPARIDAVRHFFGQRYVPDSSLMQVELDPGEERDFWELVCAPGGTRLKLSPQERAVCNRIYERYEGRNDLKGIAKRVARRLVPGWAVGRGERGYEQYEQVANLAITLAMVNHVPTMPFIPHALAAAERAVRRAVAGAALELRNVDPRDHRIVTDVQSYLRRTDGDRFSSDPAYFADALNRAGDIAAGIGRNRAVVARALEILSQPTGQTVSLTVKLASGDELQRGVEYAAATSETSAEREALAGRIRAALAGLPDPDTAALLVMINVVDDIPLDEALQHAAQQLNRPPLTVKAAAEIIAAAIPLLRTAFQPPPDDALADDAAGFDERKSKTMGAGP